MSQRQRSRCSVLIICRTGSTQWHMYVWTSNIWSMLLLTPLLYMCMNSARACAFACLFVDVPLNPSSASSRVTQSFRPSETFKFKHFELNSEAISICERRRQTLRRLPSLSYAHLRGPNGERLKPLVTLTYPSTYVPSSPLARLPARLPAYLLMITYTLLRCRHRDSRLEPRLPHPPA